MFSEKWMESSAIHQRYMDLWNCYASRGVSDALDPTDKENLCGSEMERRHYFDVGADALYIITKELIAERRPPPETILEFSSRSGRVMRYMRTVFLDAKISACDLYQPHLNFCAVQFWAVSFMSRENLDELDIIQWDLIFLGSLLTHLADYLFLRPVAFAYWNRDRRPRGESRN